MRKLIIGAISGIYNQLLDWNETISGRISYIEGCYLDLNSWFWSEQLAYKNNKHNLEILNDRFDEMPIKIKWALKNQELYLSKVEYAKNDISSVCFEPQKLYKHLEVLQLACEIAFWANRYLFNLDIAAGFVRNGNSAQELRENCINPHANPYLPFIREKIIPKIKEYVPEIIWLTGRPNIVTFAIATLIRKIFPDVPIGITYHSSEYYSLNKIIPLLMKNNQLFKVFDLIILNNDTNTMNEVENALKNGNNLQGLANIIYTPDFGNTIIKNDIYSPNENATPVIKIQPNEHPAEIKLFPKNKCYWSKCSFCGINNKYRFSKNQWNLTVVHHFLSELHNSGTKKFWLIDEAIPPTILSKIAQMILDNNWHFEWHARARIEQEFLNNELCEKLKTSGLKSILFGFESASERILYLMDKTSFPEIYLEVAENIVKKFNDHNISVHFPAIIGFPSETDEEQQRTLLFLKYLRRIYPLFSYNINIFELDISSIVYKKFAEFNISSLYYPCSPHTFIGNTIEWDLCNRIMLKNTQTDSMQHLFKWYPKHSLLQIDTFYKLLEHTRLPFWSRELYYDEQHYLINVDVDFIRVRKHISLFYNENSEVVLFDEEYLNYIIGGNILKKIYLMKEWFPIVEVLQQISCEFHESIKNLIQELVDFNILEIRRCEKCSKTLKKL